VYNNNNNNNKVIIIIISRVAMVAVSNAWDAEDCIAVSQSEVEDGSSTTSSSGSYMDYGQLRLYPDGQVRLYPESRENSEVDAHQKKVLRLSMRRWMRHWKRTKILLFVTFAVKLPVTGSLLVRKFGRSVMV
jgi:hypothetical protein